ncbi:DegV family protein [Paenibacillus assamensis]|uniref:DegV family protein n=1 Tax=Paenibacillus assamensis TaxID=311244 RepID=UPI000401BBE0|nr:DegV family protein [Paenibacillus assamensis]
MANVRIVTDSTADIPQELRERYNIEMVPLKVHFGNEMYQDAVTISPDQFYEKLANASKLPTTSQPSPVEFLEVYKRLEAQSPDCAIISIHLSAAMSGTYQSALLASSMLEEEQVDVTVIDSKSASFGIGVYVLEAAKLAQAGYDKDAILARIAQLQQEQKLYFLVDTLEYLQKGGRIAKASAMLGTLLNIKPILSIDKEGEVYAVEKVRGQKRLLQRVLEMYKEHFGDQPVDVGVGYSTEKSTADTVVAELKSQFDVQSVQYTRIGAVIGTHVGHGTVAVFVRPASPDPDPLNS